jgi:hypothetical protein
MPSTPSLPSRTTIVISILAAVFALLFAAQIASPLRLNTDSYRFLSMALSASEGHGFLVDGKPDVYPEGYPAMLAVLLHLGLGTAPWINALSMASVLAAIVAFHRILMRDPSLPDVSRKVLTLLPLASWIWVKHSIIPVSENAYCAISLCAILALTLAWQTRGPASAGWLFLGLALAIWAWRIRTVGVSLLVTGGIAVIWHPDIRALPKRIVTQPEYRWVIGAFAAVAITASGAFMLHTRHGAGATPSDTASYFQHLHSAGESSNPVSSLSVAAQAHATELGEAILNVPAARFPSLKAVFTGVGAVGALFVILGLPGMARRLPLLATYTVTYSAILLIWPFYDPRFLMPVWPAYALSIWIAAGRWRDHAGARCVISACTAVFLVLGMVALGFSTRLSLSGKHFAQIYGDGSTRDSYLVAFGLADSATAPGADPRLVRMLQRLEPLATPATPPR